MGPPERWDRTLQTYDKGTDLLLLGGLGRHILRDGSFSRTGHRLSSLSFFSLFILVFIVLFQVVILAFCFCFSFFFLLSSSQGYLDDLLILYFGLTIRGPTLMTAEAKSPACNFVPGRSKSRADIYQYHSSLLVDSYGKPMATPGWHGGEIRNPR